MASNFLSFVPDLIAAGEKLKEADRVNAANQVEADRASRLERINAKSVLQQGIAAAGKNRMDGSRLAGQQKLAYASGGIDSGSGTARQTMNSSSIFNELDTQTIQNNAIRASFGHKESARKYSNQLAELKIQKENNLKTYQAESGAAVLGAMESFLKMAGGGGQ